VCNEIRCQSVVQRISNLSAERHTDKHAIQYTQKHCILEKCIQQMGCAQINNVGLAFLINKTYFKMYSTATKTAGTNLYSTPLVHTRNVLLLLRAVLTHFTTAPALTACTSFNFPPGPARLNESSSSPETIGEKTFQVHIRSPVEPLLPCTAQSSS